MRDYHLQTPKKEHQLASRRSKSISEQTPKRPPIISQKCLNSAFASSTSEVDISLEAPKDSIDFSPISGVSDDNQIGDSAEILIAPMNLVLSPSPEMVTLSDLTLLSPITIDKDEEGNSSVNLCRSTESKSVKSSPVEAELVVNHLRQARIHVLNSEDADPQAKRLLDTLIEVVIEEFYSLPEERDWFPKMVSTKTRIVFVSLFLWILAVLAAFVFSSGPQCPFNGPAPT